MQDLVDSRNRYRLNASGNAAPASSASRLDGGQAVSSKKPAAKAGQKPKSLSRTIFKTVLAFSVSILLVFAFLTIAIFYFTYEQEAESELAIRAHDAASFLNETPSTDNISALNEQFAGWIRYTLVDADGTVLFDSVEDATAMENHADRPEIKAAGVNGEASTVRYSNTLGTDTVYAAVKLDDGSVIRLSETRHSLLSFLSEMLVPMLIALAVVAVLAFFISRILTKRIMKPLDALDFSAPLDNEIYEEMDPFLERIDEQQKLLKQQNKELAIAENLRRDFSSNVSHEMKTPLQVISGYAELLKNDMVQPADRQKFAGLIYEEAQTMRSLINDVLTLSRLDESAVKDSDQMLDLHAIAQRVAVRLDAFAKSHDVRIEVEGESTKLIGSETVAEEMLYNLFENGIRYNHPGGLVTMRIGNDEQGSVVVVSDTGPGIPEEYYDKIFERFFRVEKSRSKETGGTGLGLAIVKHGVLYHEGTIEVKSKAGEGTTFTLRFPKQG